MRILKVTPSPYSRNTISFFDLNFGIAWHQAMPSIWGCYENSSLLILTMFSVNAFFFFPLSLSLLPRRVSSIPKAVWTPRCQSCPHRTVFHVFTISVSGEACFLKASQDNVLQLPLLPAFPLQDSHPPWRLIFSKVPPHS